MKRTCKGCKTVTFNHKNLRRRLCDDCRKERKDQYNKSYLKSHRMPKSKTVVITPKSITRKCRQCDNTFDGTTNHRKLCGICAKNNIKKSILKSHKRNPESIKAAKRKYVQSEKGKAAAKRYDTSEKGKAKVKRYYEKVKNTKKYQSRVKRYVRELRLKQMELDKK